MADSTIDAISPASPAWIDRARVTASRAVHGIRPVWVVAAAIIGATSLCVVAAQAGDAGLRRTYTAEVVRAAALESSLRTQQLLDARAAIQVEDLRALSDEQLARLASAEGFLK